jgi:hypothetical protein
LTPELPRNLGFLQPHVTHPDPTDIHVTHMSSEDHVAHCAHWNQVHHENPGNSRIHGYPGIHVHRGDNGDHGIPGDHGTHGDHGIPGDHGTHGYHGIIGIQGLEFRVPEIFDLRTEDESSSHNDREDDMTSDGNSFSRGPSPKAPRVGAEGGKDKERTPAEGRRRTRDERVTPPGWTRRDGERSLGRLEEGEGEGERRAMRSPARTRRNRDIVSLIVLDLPRTFPLLAFFQVFLSLLPPPCAPSSRHPSFSSPFFLLFSLLFFLLFFLLCTSSALLLLPYTSFLDFLLLLWAFFPSSSPSPSSLPPSLTVSRKAEHSMEISEGFWKASFVLDPTSATYVIPLFLLFLSLLFLPFSLV